MTDFSKHPRNPLTLPVMEKYSLPYNQILEDYTSEDGYVVSVLDENGLRVIDPETGKPNRSKRSWPSDQIRDEVLAAIAEEKKNNWWSVVKPDIDAWDKKHLEEIGDSGDKAAVAAWNRDNPMPWESELKPENGDEGE